MVLLCPTPHPPAAFGHSPEPLNCSPWPNKSRKQEIPSTKGFQQAGGAISHCLPPGSFLQQACTRPQSCCTTGEELLTNTGTHTSTRRTANSKQAFWLYPHSPPCLWCTQTHSDYFCPSSSHDNSPNPFRVKMQWLWLQSSSSMSSCIAKLYAIKQPNISTLLVISLLQHCKRKNVSGFFYDGAATVWRKPVFCTHRKAHTYFIRCIVSCTE